MMPLRIVFAGTPAFGLPSLQALHDSKNTIVAIYTQPDRPAGRGRKLQASAIKIWAESHAAPIYQPPHFKDQSTIDELVALKPDVMVVIAYGLILPRSVLAIPSLGCINVHASYLPRWRGASPIQHAILSGDQFTGISIMQMDEGMDTGNVLKRASCDIQQGDTANTLHDRLAELAPKLLLQSLDELALGIAQPEKQDHTLVTYAPKIKKEDGKINWHQPATLIDQQIRAFNPWPVAYTTVDDAMMRVHEASILAQQTICPPGTILSIDKQGLLVKTGQDAILIKKIQFPGGKIISVADYLNASHLHIHVHMVLA